MWLLFLLGNSTDNKLGFFNLFLSSRCHIQSPLVSNQSLALIEHFARSGRYTEFGLLTRTAAF